MVVFSCQKSLIWKGHDSMRDNGRRRLFVEIWQKMAVAAAAAGVLFDACCLLPRIECCHVST
jgi:hypothetical protein